MGLSHWDQKGFRRHRRRQWMYISVTVALAASMLVVAWRYGDGFAQNLLVELGGGLLLLVGAGVLLDKALTRFQVREVEALRNLDQNAVAENFAASHRQIDILGGWSSLLTERHAKSTIDSLRSAIGKGATVRVLLLNPYGDPARIRSEELGHNPNVPEEIVRQLRKLHEFSTELPRDQRPRIVVRLYSTMPAVQANRWDDKMVMAFLSPTRPTNETQQLETFVSTPLAEFVIDKFETIWNGATISFGEYMSTTGVLKGRNGSELTSALEYFRVGNVTYVSGEELSEWLDHHALTEVRLTWAPAQNLGISPGTYWLDRVTESGGATDESAKPRALQEAKRVRRHYEAKYGKSSLPIYRLIRDEPGPAAATDAPTLD
ncbi:hypothetical protein [Stackebrandtia nassauensis]|uniref:hypothetical protein n=1 Tax=Stackebrandtia nassauensis TaxID=283811 RepID=UPI001186F30C|nr:hypothetical protein [Stackebrandtia nassauensis]